MAREGLMDDCGYDGFEECVRLNECQEGVYEKGRDDAIYEVRYEFKDIIKGNEKFTDSQKEEILLCFECAIETVKENSEC